MHRNPFALFRQFPEVAIALYEKEDRVNKDHIADFFDSRSLAMPHQVHGNRTIRVRAPTMFAEDADGIVTDAPGLTLGILTADCQSFAVYSPKQRVIGLLHAGWRGLVNGAIPIFFDVLKAEWGIEPEQSFVAMGPSLCQACSAFTDPKKELPDVDPRFFSGRLVDLRGIADDQLDRLGSPPANRERHSACTRCASDQFCSYRGPDREAVKEGWENLITCTLLG